MHLFSYLNGSLVSMTQLYFDACDEGTVYPVLGGGAASLADDGAEVALGETQTVGIVTYLVMLCTMLACQLDKAVEDGLLA